jgi:D-alanyl-D-alanine carboxypeptidase
MRCPLLCLVAVWLLVSGVALAQEAEVDAIVRAEIDKGRAPGISVAVVRAGKVVLAKGYGLANVELDAPAGPETVYQIGSLTKQFTATAVMMLAEEGKLSLADSVRKHVEDLPEAWAAVTIRHLLNHTSGIKSYTQLPAFLARLSQDVTPREIVEMSFERPLEAAPGEKWAYNNTGYVLLGMVIESASGKGYGEFLRERIFEPLGMESTMANDWGAVVPGRASGYDWAQGRLRNAPYLSMTWPFSAGNLLSSALDLAKWDAALHSGALLERETLQKMWSPTQLADGEEVSYGFGWSVGSRNGKRRVDHGGGIPGFVSHIERHLEEELTVVVLANGDASTGLIGRRITDVYLGEVQPESIEDKRPELTERVRKVVEGLQAGKVDRSLLAPEFSKVLTDALVAAASQNLRGLGSVTELRLIRHEESPAGIAREYLAIFGGNGHVRVRAMLAPDGMIAGLELRPNELENSSRASSGSRRVVARDHQVTLEPIARAGFSGFSIARGVYGQVLPFRPLLAPLRTGLMSG